MFHSNLRTPINSVNINGVAILCVTVGHFLQILPQIPRAFLSITRQTAHQRFTSYSIRLPVGLSLKLTAKWGTPNHQKLAIYIYTHRYNMLYTRIVLICLDMLSKLIWCLAFFDVFCDLLRAGWKPKKSAHHDTAISLAHTAGEHCQVVRAHEGSNSPSDNLGCFES